MGNGNNSWLFEILSDTLLDGLLCFYVNVRSGLIKYQDVITLEENSSKTEELFLSDWKCIIDLLNISVKFIRQLD